MQNSRIDKSEWRKPLSPLWSLQRKMTSKANIKCHCKNHPWVSFTFSSLRSLRIGEHILPCPLTPPSLLFSFSFNTEKSYMTHPRHYIGKGTIANGTSSTCLSTVLVCRISEKELRTVVFAPWCDKQAQVQITPASNYWELAARREQSIGVFLMTSEQEITCTSLSK